MRRLAFVFVLTASACAPEPPAESYGFVALLGRDTVSVERVQKSRSRLVTDGVDRFPFVKIRHSEFELAKDGKIRHMLMDVRTPNATTPAARGRRITADFSDNEVKIRVADSAQVRDTSFRTGGAITVPHVSMMYSVIEHEIATALRQGRDAKLAAGDSILFRQFYPDRDVGASFTLHRGYVHPMGHDTVELRHDWLSGTGVVTVDSAGRMQTYDGARSTYKVLVRRTPELPDIDAIGKSFVAAEHASGMHQLSVRDTVRVSIGNADFTIDYGRPLARGRQLLGNVIELDRVWRTGANAATQFTTTRPITLGTLDVPAGSYTLFTIPRRDRVELAVNTQTGQWGTYYIRAKDLGRTLLQSENSDDNVEAFTIDIKPTKGNLGVLEMKWGNWRWFTGIKVK